MTENSLIPQSRDIVREGQKSSGLLNNVRGAGNRPKAKTTLAFIENELRAWEELAKSLGMTLEVLLRRAMGAYLDQI